MNRTDLSPSPVLNSDSASQTSLLSTTTTSSIESHETNNQKPSLFSIFKISKPANDLHQSLLTEQGISPIPELIL